jgi:hypothetical protein
MPKDGWGGFWQETWAADERRRRQLREEPDDHDRGEQTDHSHPEEPLQAP